METILIVSPAESGKQKLAALLHPFSFSLILYASNGREARSILHTAAPLSLVIINAPLPDEPGRRLALYAAENTSASILLLVKSECFRAALAETEEEGVFLLQKPFARGDFFHTVKQGAAFQKRISAMREENARLRKQVSEIHTISRAKCLLVQLYGMTEDEAHHYIERQSMNLRQSKYAVAANLLQSLQCQGKQPSNETNLADFSY